MALNEYGIEIPDRADYGSMDTYMFAVSDVAAKTRKAAAKAAQDAAAKEASSSGRYNVAEAEQAAGVINSDARVNPSKPSVREFMDATGASSTAASEILYGTIGANQDTRDWGAIMASGDPVEAAIQGNFEQYSSGAATSNTDKSKYATFENPDGTKAGIVETDTGFALVASDGTPLRVGFNSLEKALEQGKYFGITDLLGKAKEKILAASNTEVLNLGQGEVAPIQAVPQTVTQQVTPPSYYNQPQITDNTAISNEQAGTFSKNLQTAGLSAVPQQVTYKTHYAGTPGLVDPTLVSPVGGGTGVQQVIYENNLGQRMTVTEMNGTPTTYVPPGFVRKGTMQEIAQQQQQQATGMAQGGTVRGYAAGGQPQDPMLEAKFRIANMNGYSGPKTNASLDAFANASPNMTAKFGAIGVAVAKGGYMRKGFDEGGLTKEQLDAMQRSAVSQTMQPMQAPVSYIQPVAADFVPVDAGQAVPIAPYAEAATIGAVQQANQQATPVAQTVDFTPAYQQVQAETADLTAAQGQVAPEAQVTAAQQQTSAVTGMQAAQGTATMVDAPAAREIQAGELISGSADAEKAALFNEQIQAATATPSKQATVAGQLEGLMAQFEGGETPAWAAGSMRNAMATLSARGLGASSMAGQAVIQAAMEAALPIAQMDAQVQAQFEGQNLSNRQQRAMLAAQQRATFLGMEFDQDFQSRVQNSARIGDIANMNFTAEQNIALENSRAANTMNLSNLNNRQAMVMAEAAALSQLDTQNLNNRQQAAVQNAQNFMQMDMTNLANEQQTAMFKSQQNIQALFTDQAAENAGKQFNASSQNQTDQYFANLRSQTSQFNASQQNAMDQFNVNSVNALREFNSEIQQQRDLFNAQNGLVIAQSNAQWRQNLSTLNTAAQNQSNSDFAKTMNALTSSNMDQIWQRERDLMSFAFAAAESAADRAANIAIAKLTADEQAKLQDNIGKGQLTAIATQAILGKWL